MNNHMARVAGLAKLLGVELREEFRIEKYQGIFRITEDGLQKLLDSSSSWTLAEPSIPRELLRGEETVVKFPWKPDDGEQYYVPHVDPTAMFGIWVWRDSELDLYRLGHGLVFSTPDEAAALAKKMLELAEKTLVQEAKKNG